MKLFPNIWLFTGFFISINVFSGWILANATKISSIVLSQTSQQETEAKPANNSSQQNADTPANNIETDDFIPELDLPDPMELPAIAKNEKKPPDVNVKIYGGNDLSFKFGQAFYTTEKDRLNSTSLPTTPAFSNGLVPDMDLKFNMTGNVGNQLNMNVDFDQKELLSNNQINVSFTPEDKKAFLKKLEIGNLDFDFGKSKLILYQRDSIKALGMNATFQYGDFKFSAIGAISESQRETEIFEGTRKHRVTYIDDYRYQARKYYQLEPFLYYDSKNSRPVTISVSDYDRLNPNSLNVFTSKNPTVNTPAVNIDSGSIEIFMDSGDGKTNIQLNAQPKYINGNFTGNYSRLREGKDFTILYKTGRIIFIRQLPQMSRVFVRYTRNNGSTFSTDPSSRISDGKIETFIKYGTSMNEDAKKDGVLSFNGFDDVEIIRDGVVNLDAYEVRGVYDLQAIDIDQFGFSLELYSPMYKEIPSLSSLGYYKIDYRNGTLEFSAREPFRKLDNNGILYYSDKDLSNIYSEVQPSSVYENSIVKLKAEYTASQRSYQLKHMNIVPASEKVLFNGIEVDRSKYYIDYQTGYFLFTNQNDPPINNSSKIEIHYSYTPFGQLKESYFVGSRIEYQPLKEIKVGTAAYYNGDFQPLSIEYVGHEPRGLFITGADLDLNVDENSMTSIINKMFQTKYEKVPVNFTSYGEYAHSFYNMNTMGFALIDNMESSQESMDINLNAADWTLSSIPPSLVGVNQCNRAPLYYRYYYDPQHFEYGLLPNTSNPTASPAYDVLAGPYNISYGHLSMQQLVLQNNPLGTQQKSLALDFNFSLAPNNTTPFIGIQNKVNSTVTDFSTFSQVEFYAKLDNLSGVDSGVALYLDIGSVNEDADGNNKLSTEDIGLDHIDGDTNGNNIQDAGEHWDIGERNHVLDFDRYTVATEDIGYPFIPASCPSAATRVGAGPDIRGYPATIGNGVLNSVDLNDNGQLDVIDNVINIDPANPALQFESGSNVLLPGNWQHFKIFINPELMTQREKLLFRNIESIRVYAVPVGASRLGSGKIFIDQIRFSGSQWKRKKKKLTAGSETLLTNQTIFKVTNIDNFNTKDEYENESFLLKKRDEYEKLYGKKTNNEIYTIKEGSLKLEYNLPSTHDYVTVEKIFTEPMDISYYKKINIWVNHRQFSSSGGSIFFRIGNDDTNYIEFIKPIDKTGWQKYELTLNQPGARSGKPEMNKTRFISIGIQNSSPNVARNGISWVDDIFVSDVIIKSDYAYTYGAGVIVTKPLFVTEKGTPLFSDLSANYYRLYRNYDFQSIAATGPAFMEDHNNFNIKTKAVPFWITSYSLDDYKSDTSRLYNITENYRQGLYLHTQHRTQNEFFNNMEYVPHVAVGLSYNTDQTLYEGTNVNSDTVKKVSVNNSYQPDIRITHKIPTFIKVVNIDYKLYAASTFYNKETNEKIQTVNKTIIDNKITEKDQWQQSNESIHLSIANLNILTSHIHNQALLLQKNTGDYAVSRPINGKYYFPFINPPTDYRIQQRNNGLYFETEYTELWKFSPKASWEVKYYEDSFRDNPERLYFENFQRLKNSNTLTAFSLAIPLVIRGSKKKEVIDNSGESLKQTESFSNSDNSLYYDMGSNITLGFRRELKLQEFSVPFTAKSSIENDQLGISRVYPKLSSTTFNLANYPFWYFFSSPPGTGVNFYNGRQFINKENLSIEPDYSTGFASQYDNALQLMELASLNSRWPLNTSLTITTDSKLSQEASRNAIHAAVIQEGDFNNNVQFIFNLMNILNFGYWKNKSNNSILILALGHDTRMYIVSNIEENVIKPDINLQFKWLSLPRNVLSGISIRSGFGIHSFAKHQYLTAYGIDPTLQNEVFGMEELYSVQNLINYNVSLEWFTEIAGLKHALENFIRSKIEHNPRYSMTLAADINRHKVYYFNKIRNDLIDEFSIKNSLDINVHQNVTGIIDFLMVYDIHRHPDDNHIIQEIFAMQGGISLKILF
ncbi:MAG: hypothetical protein OEV78_08825 [Spirochaetia bacterium]|nr:hypothetical protein [Spirochaetia bacterium]